MIVTVEQDEFGDAVIQLPDEIIEKFNLKPGDNVWWSIREDGSIEMSFDKKEDVEIDLDEKTLLDLAMLAHKQDITLNQLVENILRKSMNEHTVTVPELEEKLDDIVDDIASTGSSYFVVDENGTELAVLIPYKEE